MFRLKADDVEEYLATGELKLLEAARSAIYAATTKEEAKANLDLLVEKINAYTRPAIEKRAGYAQKGFIGGAVAGACLGLGLPAVSKFSFSFFKLFNLTFDGGLVGGLASAALKGQKEVYEAVNKESYIRISELYKIAKARVIATPPAAESNRSDRGDEKQVQSASEGMRRRAVGS